MKRTSQAGGVSRVQLTMAISAYDHVRDLVTGEVRAEGIDLVPLELPIEEIFYRFTRYREWDVSELSLAKYCSMVSAGDETLTAIPVFPSRVFRHSAIYVRAEAGITAPGDLAGRRVGVPEWSQTAGVYVRGMLAEHHGLDLAAVDWYQAGVDEAGRAEKVGLHLPPGVEVRSMADQSLSELLLAGKLDAVISARPPRAFREAPSDVVRLFPDHLVAEAEWWRVTGVFPIMHVVALRRDVVDAHPWVAMNLFSAFDRAKTRSLERCLDMTASRVPIPWAPVHASVLQAAGCDPWPYGVEDNRVTLGTFLRYAQAQGVCGRHLAVEELFWPQVLTSYRV